MRRTALCVAGLILAFLLGEGLLAALDLPRFRAAHSRPPQFAFLPADGEGPLLWTNVPATTIVFEYEDDPFGTLGPGARVEHRTNARGFRGPDWMDERPPDLFRVAVLGDSFAFGEGVRDEDTLPARLERLLAERLARESEHAPSVEVLNLGVGGVNTVLERELLERWALPARPDLVLVVFVPNDAEPPAFRRDPRTGSVQALGRGADFPKGGAEPRPPKRPWLRPRSARLVWKLVWSRERTQRTVEHYLALYQPSSIGWQRARRALLEIGRRCREEQVPLVVALYPILVRLETDHPLAGVHAEVRRAAEQAGALAVDLLPAFQGERSEALWVHPTDQHPNARAHEIAAAFLVERIAAAGLLPVSSPRSAR